MGSVVGGALGLGIVLSLKDKVTSTLEKIKAKFGAFVGASEADIKRFNDGIKMMGWGVASMAAGFALLSKTLGGPVRGAVEFQSAMGEVGTLIPGQTQALEKLSDAALDLSMKFGKSQQEMASAQYQAISAGIAAEHAASFVDTAGKMAIGGITDTKTAVDGLTSVINAYGLAAEEAENVSDTFFTAMKLGKTTVGELASVVGDVAPLASSMGMAYDELFSAIAAATLKGQSTAAATTGVRGILAGIVGPSEEAVKAAAKLGIEWNMSAVQAKGLIGVLQEVNEKTGGNAEVMRTLIPRIEGYNTMLGLVANNAEAFSFVMEQMEEKAGATQQAFETMSATLKFKFTQLGATFDVIKTKIGNVLLPIVTAFTNGLIWVSRIVAQLPAPFYALIASVFSLAGAALILGGAMLTVKGLMLAWGLLAPALKIPLVALRGHIVSTTKTLVSLPSMMIKSFGMLRTHAFPAVIRGFTSLKAHALPTIQAFAKAHPLFLKLAGAGALLYAAWKQNWGGLRDMVTAVVEGFRMAVSAGEDGIASVDAKLADKLKESGIWDFAVTMGRVFYRLRQFAEGFAEGFKGVFSAVSTAAQSVWNAIKPAIDTGKIFLEMLGLFKPVAESSTDAWRKWGQALGAAAATVVALVVAFKSASAITGIVHGITWAFNGLKAAFVGHPIVMAIVAIVVVLYQLWKHWDDVVAAFNAGIERIKSFFAGAGEWIKEKWEPVKSLFSGFPEFIGGTLGGLKDIIFAPFKAAFALVEGGIGLLKKIWDGFMSLFSSEVTQIDAETAAKVNSDAAAVSDRFAGSRFLGGGDSGGGAPIPGVAPIATHEEPEPVMLAARSTQDAPAAPILAAQKETDAALAAGASGAAAARPVEVKSDVSVTVEPVKQDIYLDGEKVGECSSAWIERQNMRAGRSSIL